MTIPAIIFALYFVVGVAFLWWLLVLRSGTWGWKGPQFIADFALDPFGPLWLAALLWPIILLVAYIVHEWRKGSDD